MKRYYLEHFPGPVAETHRKGFLAELAELDETNGSPFEMARRTWTKKLYEASFDCVLKDTMVNPSQNAFGSYVK